MVRFAFLIFHSENCKDEFNWNRKIQGNQINCNWKKKQETEPERWYIKCLAEQAHLIFFLWLFWSNEAHNSCSPADLALHENRGLVKQHFQRIHCCNDCIRLIVISSLRLGKILSFLSSTVTDTRVTSSFCKLWKGDQGRMDIK